LANVSESPPVVTNTPREPATHAAETALDESTALVVGLGEVGRPLLDVLSSSHSVVGRDVEDLIVNEVGILHLCYPFGDEFVSSASEYVRAYQPSVVILNSTVAPGTSRAIQERAGVPVVYSPIRGKHVMMHEEIRRYDKFVAGTSEFALEAAERHFTKAGIATRRMSSLEGLELAKLLETTYLGLLVAWAQEIDRFASDLTASYEEVLEFFCEVDFLPTTRFQPGYIGGHCVMPNLDLLESVRPSPFIDAIRQSNDARHREWQAIGRSLSDRLSPLP
jgi:UDP-N-acetyl-D-mannosaminuronate dehydrogenase